jgi:hypothetical protein
LARLRNFPARLANRHARPGRAARIAAVGGTFGRAAWIFDWASDFGYCGRGACLIEGGQGTRAEIGGKRMTLLMYVMAFGWTLVLFASLIGLAGWLLVKLLRWLTEPPDPKQTTRGRERWDLNQLKRAGQ